MTKGRDSWWCVNRHRTGWEDLFTQRLAASATSTTTPYRTRVSRNRGRHAAHTESSVYEPPRFAEEADDTKPSPAAGIEVNASTNWVYTD